MIGEKPRVGEVLPLFGDGHRLGDQEHGGSVANFSFQSFSYGDHSHRSGDRDVQRQAF
jgi:hypothetical protein